MFCPASSLYAHDPTAFLESKYTPIVHKFKELIAYSKLEE